MREGSEERDNIQKIYTYIHTYKHNKPYKSFDILIQKHHGCKKGAAK